MQQSPKNKLFILAIFITLLVTACTNMGGLDGSVCSVTSSKCTGCGNCLSACPHSAISLSGGKASINANKCTGCGRCISRCPSGAISYN